MIPVPETFAKHDGVHIKNKTAENPDFIFLISAFQTRQTAFYQMSTSISLHILNNAFLAIGWNWVFNNIDFVVYKCISVKMRYE